MFEIIVFETTQRAVATAKAKLWNSKNKQRSTYEYRAGLNPCTGRYTVWKVVNPVR